MGFMIAEHRATLDGRPVRFLDAGTGWPVVLLHAFPMSADMWRPQLERAPTGWRFVAPDMRGATVDEMAAGVLRLLDHLDIERAVIGGLSMGGYVTFAAYRLAPERFSGMLLANTRATADTPQARDGREKMIALARERGSAAIAAEMLPKLLGRTTQAERPEVQAFVRQIAESRPPEAIVEALGAMLQRPDSTPGLDLVSSATLVIAAEEDTLIPAAEIEAMQLRIPRSRLVVLHRAGHLSNLEAPDEFSRALADFLTSNM